MTFIPYQIIQKKEAELCFASFFARMAAFGRLFSLFSFLLAAAVALFWATAARVALIYERHFA